MQPCRCTTIKDGMDAPQLRIGVTQEIMADPKYDGSDLAGFYGYGRLEMWSSRKYRINPYLQADYSKKWGDHQFHIMAAISYRIDSIRKI